MKEDTNGFNLEDIDFEDKSKRKETEKHYKLKDGSFVAAIYNSPIHYWDDKDNCYHTVDNTLVETDDAFENTKGSFKARFAKTPENGTSIMKLAKEGRSIEWEYLPTRKSKFDKAKIKQRIDAAPSSLPTLHSVGHIRYPEVCKNADLEYNVTPTGIKENIVIKAKKGSYKFAFKLKVNGYDVREINDELHFFPTNATGEEKAEYKIPKLFMTDRKGKRCDNVKFTLEKHSDEAYIFTVIPDANWINDEYRVFPVMVDPSLEYITVKREDITSLSYSSKGNCLDSYSNIRKIGFETPDEEYVSYFHVPTLAIPENYDIIDASLWLSVNENRYMMFDVHLLNEYWDFYYPYFYKPTTQPEISDLINFGYGLPISLTNLYRKWATRELINYGFMICSSYWDCNTCSAVCQFDAEGSYEVPPTFTVRYKAKNIDRTFRPEHASIDVPLGLGGNGKIDLYNGGVIIEVPQLTCKNGKTVPMTSLVFNNAALTDSTLVGKKWKTVQDFSANKLKDDFYAKYIDILENEFELTNYLRSSNVLYYTCIHGIDYEYNAEDTTDTLKDMQGNVWSISSNKKIYTARTGEVFTIDTSSETDTITDNHSNKYTVVKTSGYISLIKPYNASDDDYIAKYEYTSGRLTKITYWNGEYAQYTYTANGMISTISDSLGNNYVFDYINGNTLSSIKVCPKYSTISNTNTSTSNGTATEEINIEYYHNRAVVKDPHKTRTVYYFDDNGRAIMTYNDFGGTYFNRGLSTPTNISLYKKTNESDLKVYKFLDVTENCDELPNLLNDTSFSTLTRGEEPVVGKWVYSTNVRYSSLFRVPGTGSINISSGSVCQSLLFQNGIDCNTLIFSAWVNCGIAGVDPITTPGPKIKVVKIYTASNPWLPLIDSSSPVGDYETHINKCTSKTDEFEFDPSYNGWQYGAIAIETTLDTVYGSDNEYTLSGLIVYLDKTGNPSSGVVFNNPRLVACNGNHQAHYAIKENNTPKIVSYTNNGEYITTQNFDDNFNVISENVTHIKNNTNYTNTYTYYDNNKLKTKLDYKGLRTYYRYNSNGLVENEIVGCNENLSGGYSTTTHYNSNQQVDYTEDADGKETKYSYDNLGRLVKITSPAGRIIEYTYNDKNQVTAITGNVTDNENNVIASLSNNLSYNKGLNTGMQDFGASYNIAYTGDGRRKAVYLGNTLIASSNCPNPGYAQYETITYGNGNNITVKTNGAENPEKIYYTENNNRITLSEMKYDGNGKLISVIDSCKNVRYEYKYDIYGNVTSVHKITPSTSTAVADTSNLYISYTYDSIYHDKLNSYTYHSTGITYYVDYMYYDGKLSLEREIRKITALNFGSEEIEKDKYSRPTNKYIKNANGVIMDSSQYVYGRASLPTNISKPPRDDEEMRNESYTYDDDGNILTYSSYGQVYAGMNAGGYEEYEDVNVESHEYEYDGFNRLIKEVFDGVEYRYSYDAAGNILSKEEYRNGTLDNSYNFVYNTTIKNRLVRINSYRSTDTVQNSFTECTYDTLGLPTKYRNKTLTWDKRNQLASYNGITFTYDGSGMRLTKGSKVYEYDGDTLLSETNGNDVIKFIYGISGLIGFLYNGTPYYYVRNMLGDVKSIKSANGTIVAEYKYDAWGKCTIASQTGLYLGTKNPIRYRGYFYDEETKLYYLQSRYYDPEIGRFISPDSTKYLDPETLGGLNLYAYCNNNPVMYADPSGCSILALWLIVGIASLAGATIGGIQSYQSGERGWDIIESIALGFFIGGAIAGAAIVLTSATWIAIFGAKATILGVEAIKAFAVGAVAVNTFSYIGATFYGAKTEMLELPAHYNTLA